MEETMSELAAPGSTPLQVVERMLERISALDPEGALQHVAEDLRFELMFLPDGGEPQVRNGRAEMAKSMPAAVAKFKSWHIWVTAAYPTTDPEVIISEWQSRGQLKTGEIYENRYIGIQRVVNGEIKFWREYAHPNPMVMVFGQRPM